MLVIHALYAAMIPVARNMGMTIIMIYYIT